MGWRPHHRPGVGLTGPVQRPAEQHPHQRLDTEGEVSLLPHLGRGDLPAGERLRAPGYEAPSADKGGGDSLVVRIPAHALSPQLSGIKMALCP